ncbi:TlpA family protein disulfide reductase [Agromyces intestinalis]|uniref:TlpA family protein disulfide reductase n=1 Tax=Agromyces intestinalis TaxID=2592652 RepID=A0A5C1YDQ5_9MICO|nr:TlpA disulfide reductase family protein [Agromyces intestinalis]QEO13127.1 TlpA family protein disulfide reductase [Agromyces intestinalis]
MPLHPGVSRSITAAATAVLLALTLAGCTSGPRGGADRLPGPVPGDITFAATETAPNAPAIDAKLVDGTTVDGDDLWGERPAVLQFITSWCTRCDEQQGVIAGIARDYGDALTVVLVAGDPADGADDLLEHLDELGVDQPVIHDPDLRIWRSYAVDEPPMTALIDADGRLVKLWPGGADETKLRAELDRIIQRG